MNKPLKIALTAFIAGVAIAGCICLWLLRWIAGDQVETANEIKVTPEFATGFKSAGFPVTVKRGFEASSYGGWHGDGISVTAYLYSPSESPALIAALKDRYPSYVWSYTTSKSGRLGEVKDQLPKDFLPQNNWATLLEGKPAEAFPFLEFVICPAEGLFYSVNNRF